MKRYRQILAAFLAVCVLFLSGCNLFETKLARAVEKMSRKDNCHFTLSVDLELALKADSDSEDGAERALTLPGRFEAEGILYANPLQMRANAGFSMAGSKTRWECWLEKDEGAYYLYSRLNDGTLWQKQGLADDGKNRVKGLGYIVKGAESFAPAGEETLGDLTAERYDGVIPGEYISGLLKIYRLQEWLSDELGLQLADGLFDDLADVPCSVWMDTESRMIVRAEAELGDLLSQLVSRQLAENREAVSFDTLGLDVSLEKAHLSLLLSDFDGAEAFHVPAEAKSAWGGEAMPWDS